MRIRGAENAENVVLAALVVAAAVAIPAHATTPRFNRQASLLSDKPAPAAHPDLVRLQAVAGNALPGRTGQRFSLEVPDQAVSLLVTARAGQGCKGVTFSGFADPRLEDRAAAQGHGGPLAGGMESPTRTQHPFSLISEEASVLMTPSADRAKLAPGRHDFCVSAVDAAGKTSPVQIEAVCKIGPQLPARGTLALNVFFAGGCRWTVENAGTDPQFKALVDRVQAIFQKANIEVHPRLKKNLPPAQVDGGGLRKLLSYAPDERAANLFFVNSLGTEIVRDVAGRVFGFSSALPAPLRGGGVVLVPAGEGPSDGFLQGTVAAHELGHLLGLGHTIEVDGREDDLPDTNPVHTGNLMYPVAANQAIIVSPQQAQRLRLHPLVSSPTAGSPEGH